jgi:ribose-phosphate pyrophosphokinase
MSLRPGHPELGEQVAQGTGCPGDRADARDFANGEIFVRFDESVRGCDAFVLQSHPAPLKPVADGTADHVRWPSSAAAPSAITAILPFYPYARQDKKHRAASRSRRAWSPIAQDRRRRPDRVRRPAHRPDPGLLRRPGGPRCAPEAAHGYIAEHFSDHDMVVVVSPDSGRVRGRREVGRLPRWCAAGLHPQGPATRWCQPGGVKPGGR